MAARAYYAQATDDAYELGDHAVAGIGHDYSGRLAVNNRQLRAALHHLSCADALGVVDATILSWLATIEADAHAALGDAAAASTAQGRAQELFRSGVERQAVAWFAANPEGLLSVS